MVEAAAQPVVTVQTTAYQDQKAGTSGLRKKTVVFADQPNYLENFVASIFAVIPDAKKKLVVSGDGRYWNDVAIQKIIKIAAAQGVTEVIVGQHGLLSTPAISNLIRQLNASEEACLGAILLTASHNPGGPTEDFGIKFNTPNGGPAPETITNAIFEKSKTITEFRQVSSLADVDLGTVAETSFQVQDGEQTAPFKVSVVDNTEAYVALMKTLFNFEQIKDLLSRSDFKICIDGMHGVAGPYANAIFTGELGVSADQLMRCNVLPDFGGGHPDPNLTYAADLVAKMGVLEPKDDAPEFAAACDGDADRNMILGKNFFVTPSDSVAIIVAQAKRLPYLSGGISGAARSMPTSAALDNVCKKLGLPCFETPTGWKFFGNLLDADKIAICGEESFGTGSNHVREKDGLWAVLAWLQILADVNKDKPEGELVGIAQIVKDHWAEYGRNYYQRYDYEGLETAQAQQVFSTLDAYMAEWTQTEGQTAQNFTYTDPVTGDVTPNQGYIFTYADGSRFVFRLSGTGSSGATIRVYLEKFSQDASMDAAAALAEIATAALAAGKI